jgi:hypothetical protein
MLKGKSSNQREGEGKLKHTSAHVQATWTFDVPLANQIFTIIKSYQVPISPNPCKLQFNYLVINPETDFSPTTIITTQTTNI